MQEVVPEPVWRLEDDDSMLVADVTVRPAHKVRLTAHDVESLIERLAEARGRMLPAPLAWRTEGFLKRLRSRLLAPR